jgi:hypothetical protein
MKYLARASVTGLTAALYLFILRIGVEFWTLLEWEGFLLFALFAASVLCAFTALVIAVWNLPS